MGRGGVSTALVHAPYPTKLYFTIKHEGFFTVLFSFQLFFNKRAQSNFPPQSLLAIVLLHTAHSCNFVRLLIHLFLSAEVFAKKTLRSINKLIFFSDV